ncbi:MAG: Spy/CpxP family protein refolding chaperone [Phenylobacterium sp.]
MTTTIRRAALAALAAASLAGSAAWTGQAWAQQDDHRGPPGDMRARMQALREAHERQYAQDLRTILRLRPDQDAALAAYLQSHRRPESPPDGRGGPPDAPMTTPQRLDAMARREAEHAEMQRRHAEALRAFYAALNPDQRQVFDALQRMHGEGHEHGGWGGHPDFGGPMDGHGGRPGGPPPPRDD